MVVVAVHEPHESIRMSQLTDYAENKLADWVRGQSLPFASSWRWAPLSAADDGSLTEVTGTGIARFVMTRNLTNMSGTQGAGTTLASTGTSHVTSNNVAIDCGTATGAVGTVTHLGLFDATSGGNCWAYTPLDVPIVTANGVAILFPINSIAFSLGLTGGMTDYLANKLIDLFFRGQSYSWPATTYLKALIAAPTNAGGGTEVGGGVGYARVAIASSYASWSGTQSPGTTVASTGTTGRISNNAQLLFPDPTGAWGAIGWGGLDDASSAGNPLFWGALTTPKSIGVGVPLVYAANTLGITWA